MGYANEESSNEKKMLSSFGTNGERVQHLNGLNELNELTVERLIPKHTKI